jgi:hypothetical protein
MLKIYRKDTTKTYSDRLCLEYGKLVPITR